MSTVQPNGRAVNFVARPEPQPEFDEPPPPWPDDFESWVEACESDPDWGPDDVVCLTEAEVDGTARTLGDFLDDAASYYNSIGTNAGRWLAGELVALRDRANYLGATTVEVFERRNHPNA